MPAHFVGGQTPLQQQLPYKRGFKNNFRKVYVLVNLDQLAAIETEGDLTPDVLEAAGLIRNTRTPVKILAGEGEVTRALRVSAHKVSTGARQAIEAAGGSVTLLDAAAGEAEATDATQEAGA
jgi:large subunit ribosomal protein L15